jgi:hypothetical protein
MAVEFINDASTFTDDQVAAQYVPLLDLLTGVVRNLLWLPLAQMALVNEQMQVLAPVLEPTAYGRGGATNLHDQRKVIDGALALHRVLRSLEPKAADHV